MRRLNVDVEILRGLQRRAYGLLGTFVNLDAVESGLANSRLIEYPFVVRHLKELSPGRLLDVGCTDPGNVLAPILAALGWEVYGIDVREFALRAENFHFVRADLSQRTGFQEAFFDAVYAVSSIEHFGLAGRYSVTKQDDHADRAAIAEIRRITRPGAAVLLTLPYGTGGIVRSAERVYNQNSLTALIDGWTVRETLYMYLDNRGAWHHVSEEIARRTRTPGGVCVALVALTR